MNPAGTAKQTPPEPRSYHSPLREHQSEQTRDLILDAATQELAQGGLRELNIPSIARRARVSVRTVYRYFPTRETLLDALTGWLQERVVAVPPAASVEELQSSPLRTFPAFDQNEALVRAHWLSGPGRDIRSRGRRRRQENYRRVLSEVTAKLSPNEQRSALTMVAFLLSSRTWQAFKDDFGMDGEESGKAVSWALRTLIADVRARNEQANNVSRSRIARKETN